MDVLDDALSPIGAHRCDRCPQAAVSRLATAKGPLFFCGHHSRRLPPEYEFDLARDLPAVLSPGEYVIRAKEATDG